MNTSMRRRLAIAAGAAVLVGGAGAAVGATQLSRGEESKAVVEDAAKQLGVDPAKLNAALKQALENRVDEAVESGRLTEEQAARLKERIRADEYPLFGGPGLRGHGMRGHGRALGHHRLFGGLEAAAAYLGLTEDAVRASLREGKTLAALAREHGKTVAGLVDALVEQHAKRLDAAVEAGRLTEAQRDAMAARLKEGVTAMVNGERPALGKLGKGKGPRGGKGARRGQGFGFGRPDAAPPGSSAPREGAGYRGGDEPPPAA